MISDVPPKSNQYNQKNTFQYNFAPFSKYSISE